MTKIAEGLRLTDALVRLSHLVQQVFADIGRARELTPQQAQLLCVLTREPVGMTELSRLLHLEKSSLTGLVDRVQRRGLVVRTRDSQDRRAWKVELTSQGARLAADTHDAVTARLGELVGDLRSTDQQRLISVITRLLVRDGAATGRVWTTAD